MERQDHELSSDDVVEVPRPPNSTSTPLPNALDRRRVETPLETGVTPKGKVQRSLMAYFPVMDESGQCAADASPAANLSTTPKVIPLAKSSRTPTEKRRSKPRVHESYIKQVAHIDTAKKYSTIVAASKATGVPTSTLQDWMKKETEIRRKATSECGHDTKEAPLILYASLAAKLLEYIEWKRRASAPITRQLAVDFCDSKDKHFRKLQRETKFKTVSRFLKRANKVLRKPTNVAQAFPPTVAICRFFVRLTGALRKMLDSIKMLPKTVVVLDETSVAWRPIAQRVIADRGARTITVNSKGCEKQCSTALLAGVVDIHWDAPDRWRALDQRHLNPLILFKGKPDKCLQRRLAPYGAKYNVEVEVTENGWITAKTFGDWCTRHLQNLPQPVWLFMDVHTTHEATRELLKGFGIDVWFIPHGCTGQLQVHDTHINAPFKQAMREQFNYHLASHSRGADDRGQAKYTDIIRWVRTAMSSVPTTLLTKGLATNILCPEVLSGVPTEKENPDADEAFASYMADMAAEKAAKEKKKQDAIDLKKQKAKTKEEKAQQKKVNTPAPAAPTPPAPKLVIKKMNSRAPAAPTPPAPEAKKTGSVGSKRPRVSQTVTIGDNMSGPANITLNVTMPAFEMPLVETRLLRGILPKSPIQRPFVPQDEEEDLETYDAELVDCYPDWLDEQREDENRASFENEEEYINDFISRLYDAQESTRDFPPRTILQAGEPDDEELDAFDLCDEEEDLNRFNDDGEFIWDEPEEPHVVDCDDSGQVLDFSESAEDSAHCGDAEDSMLDFSESAEDTAHRGDAEDSMLDDSGCFEE